MRRFIIPVACVLLFVGAIAYLEGSSQTEKAEYLQKAKEIFERLSNGLATGLLKGLNDLDKTHKKLKFADLKERISTLITNVYQKQREQSEGDYEKALTLYAKSRGKILTLNDDFKAVFKPPRELQTKIHTEIKSLLIDSDKDKAGMLGFHEVFINIFDLVLSILLSLPFFPMGF